MAIPSWGITLAGDQYGLEESVGLGEGGGDLLDFVAMEDLVSDDDVFENLVESMACGIELAVGWSK